MADNNYIKILKKNKIRKKIIDVVSEIKRENFFDPIFRKKAMEVDPLPVGYGQKSDDLVTLARMIQTLSPKKNWRLLEIGTGSGYSTSLLASMVKEVVTIDYKEKLAKKAKERVINQGIYNAKFYAGDATVFAPDLGEFDAVIVLAACSSAPLSIFNVLKNNGVCVFPMGPPFQQQITTFRAIEDTDDIIRNFMFSDMCKFDSIRGSFGWEDQQSGYLVDEVDF